MDVYDPTADSWSSIASMEARRRWTFGCHTHNINTFTSTLGVAVLNDHIYAVGGFDGSCGLNTAEVMVEHGDQEDKEKQTIGNYPNTCSATCQRCWICRSVEPMSGEASRV